MLVKLKLIEGELKNITTEPMTMMMTVRRQRILLGLSIFGVPDKDEDIDDRKLQRKLLMQKLMV